MKNSYLTVTDQFCGAGGSSQGVRNYANKSGGGLEVKLALNHWKLAIETHNTNFPDTDHDCTDIQACDPKRYRATDILITSPECTNHSLAKGQKRKNLAQMELTGDLATLPEAERSRATMWDVCRFAEYHDYNAIITENVVEARYWVGWNGWIQAMKDMGYQHECKYLNSMHFAPTPQSRDRMYVVFWKKGNPKPDLKHTPAAHCPECGKDVQALQTWKNTEKKWGKHKTQYVFKCPVHGVDVKPYYHAAFNAIDWTIEGNPASGYSENTKRRIQYGLDKYKGNPYMVYLDHSKAGDKLVSSLGDASKTQTTTDNAGLVVPFIVNNNGQSKVGEITKPFGSQTGCTTQGIVNPTGMKAFLSYYYGTSQATHITEPTGALGTVDTAALVRYEDATLDNCMYRTIRPHEVQQIMAFDNDYQVLGNSKQKVKQLGNAVTPPVMEWLIGQVVETLE